MLMDMFHLAERPCVAEAIAAAVACKTRDEVEKAIRAYKGHDVAAVGTYAAPSPTGTEHPLMILAEKPETADLTEGRPFSGEYGAVMREVLDWTGIDLNKVDISYAVHWNPGDEKSLNATQISASRPFMFRTIEMVRPRAILMLGRGVYEAMFNRRDPITPLLGMTMTWERGDLAIPCRLINHPAWAHRFRTEIPAFGQMVQDFVDDYAHDDEILATHRHLRKAA